MSAICFPRAVVRDKPRIRVVSHNRYVGALFAEAFKRRRKALAVLPNLPVGLRLYDRLFFAVSFISLRLVAHRILRAVRLRRLD